MSESAQVRPAAFADDDVRQSTDMPAHATADTKHNASATFMIQPPRRGPSTGFTRGGGRYFVAGARFGGGGPPHPLGGEFRERPIDARENVLARVADEVLT